MKRAGWTGTYKKCFCPTCNRDKRGLTVNIRQIDANALHAEISKWPESVMYKDWVQSAIANAPTITQPEVDQSPVETLNSIDRKLVEQVWRGRWMTWAGGLAKCPICGHEYTDRSSAPNFAATAVLP